jgi:ABC-type transporter MlaC component
MPGTNKMKRLPGLLFLFTLATSALSQKITDTSYSMTSDQNKEWLTRIKNADKKLKLKPVSDRLFAERESLKPSDSLDVPVLIIDGSY